ncbi:tetratricopeptide repeat protein [Sphingomonas arenae]|nr:tetratricopeptide repeat protein [Sphingomonas arenae]
MLLLAALAGAIATPSLDEATRALAAGRPEQARQMIASAVASGASGPAVDRLLADLAFQEGDWVRASAGYAALLPARPSDAHLLQQAGIAALHMNRSGEATMLLDKAVAQPGAGWRAWNARAVAADRQKDWGIADRAYAQALKVSPDNPQLLNNRGWSMLLRGEWSAAVGFLERAAALTPEDAKIAANLDLARSAVAESLPARRPGESDGDWAARLNDAGVIAFRRGDRQKAIAAFAQALETSDRWFARAANNLAYVESKK